MSAPVATSPTEPLKSNKWFVRRITAATAWGEGLDGYDLGAISVVLPAIAIELGLSPLMFGLIGASTLIGIFFGGPIAGQLSDKFGRRRLFTLDIIAFIILGLSQLFVYEGWVLLVVRLLLGVAIGAEYAIGSPLLAELTPSKGRGERLAYLQVFWYVGFLLAVALAYLMVHAGWHWRVILATSALPAVGTMILRHGMPESPRWLISKGRIEEARAIVDRHLGGATYFIEEELDGEVQKEAGYRDLFAPGVRTKTLFVSIFWFAMVAPYFAIFTFAPLVFTSLHVADERLATIGVNTLAAIGALAGMLLVDRMGRRSLLLSSFYVMIVALVILGAWGGAPSLVLIVCFAAFAFSNAASGVLTGVYPAEIFPSELRARGTGFAASFSRIGAAAGTFLLPVGTATIGIGPSVLIGAAICVAGLVVTHLWAPETKGLSLTRTAATHPPVMAKSPFAPPQPT